MTTGARRSSPCLGRYRAGSSRGYNYDDDYYGGNAGEDPYYDDGGGWGDESARKKKQGDRYDPYEDRREPRRGRGARDGGFDLTGTITQGNKSELSLVRTVFGFEMKILLWSRVLVIYPREGFKPPVPYSAGDDKFRSHLRAHIIFRSRTCAISNLRCFRQLPQELGLSVIPPVFQSGLIVLV